MLRISKKADYALAFLGHMARAGAFPGGSNPDTVTSAQSLSDLTGLHKSVVANLLKDLTRDGILTSTRGLKGGYRLSVAPADLTFHRILKVVDGPFHLVECCDGAHSPIESKTGEGCTLVHFCPSRSPMQLVNQRFEMMLESLTLDELCGMTLPRNPRAPTVETTPQEQPATP